MSIRLRKESKFCLLDNITFKVCAVMGLSQCLFHFYVLDIYHLYFNSKYYKKQKFGIIPTRQKIK